MIDLLPLAIRTIPPFSLPITSAVDSEVAMDNSASASSLSFGTPPDDPVLLNADEVPQILRVPQSWVYSNPFFSPVVRLQTECGHRVIEAGPYKFMRHPGHFAMSVSIPASALAIGSWFALVPAIGSVLVVSRRARLEDEFLMWNLSG